MVTVYIALGSNMGDRHAYLDRALTKMEESGIHIKKLSSRLETKAYGYTKQADFINMVAEAETLLSPDELLHQLQSIEKSLDRVREVRWGPRTIDLDILFYGSEVIRQTNLEIPHKDMIHRDFVLKPLQEIAPSLMHPVYLRPIQVLYEEYLSEQSAE